MILVDASVWIDHLHRPEPGLVDLLEDAQICVHPMIIGELALGSLHDRSAVLWLLGNLPSTAVVSHAEVLRLVEFRTLYGIGLSLVDAHLLAALLLSDGISLWTRDRRLRLTAKRLGIASDLR
jgi:predicted nucleic acid-binding protein